MEKKRSPSLLSYTIKLGFFVFGGLLLFSIANGDHHHGYQMFDIMYDLYLVIVAIIFYIKGFDKLKGFNKIYFIGIIFLFLLIGFGFSSGLS